jgi:isopentenyl diphosphate isomerase/L-lactate dehydrogenase-like FMN-dependent dehydrogenase
LRGNRAFTSCPRGKPPPFAAIFGCEPVVARVLAILRVETRNAMQQLGAPSVNDLTPAMARRV